MKTIVKYFTDRSKKYAGCTDYEKWEHADEVGTVVSDVLACVFVFAMCVALVFLIG